MTFKIWRKYYRVTYLPKDGRYIKNKRVFWYWTYYNLPAYGYWYLCTPIGAIKFDY